MIAFTVAETVKPIGKVYLRGDRAGASLTVSAVAPSSAAVVREALLGALLAEPNELRRAKITVVYTSLEDPKHGLHTPYTLGWDGRAFVSHDSPEQTVFPENIEGYL